MTYFPIPLASTTAEARSSEAGNQRLTNLYASRQRGGKGDLVLYQRYGLSGLGGNLGGSVRGSCAFDGKSYVVAGSNLTEITEAGTATVKATSAINGTGQVTMSPGRNSISITVKDTTTPYYNWNGTNLSAITTFSDTTDGLPNFDDVTYLDGYHIFSVDEDGTSPDQWFISQALDGRSIEVLDFATAEKKADPLRGVLANNNYLMLFGSESLEFWYNSGRPDFPFQRQSVASDDVGLANTFAKTKLDNNVTWLSNNLVVLGSKGPGDIQRLSGDEQEYQISEWTDPQATHALSYRIGGLNFHAYINADGCLVYNENGTWSENLTYDTTSNLTTWEVRSSHQLNENWYIGQNDSDTTNNSLLRFLENNLEDRGNLPILKEFVSPHIHFNDKRFSVNKLVLEMEANPTGATSGDAVNLEVSKDEGRTYGTAKPRTFKTGNKRRFVWHALGQFRSATFKFWCDDSLRWSVANCYADITMDEV